MPAPQPANNSPAGHGSGRRKHVDWAGRTVRIELFIVLLGSALLLAAVSLYVALSSTLSSEAKRVKTDKYQAVFLNGGATSGAVAYTTYFGQIKSLNDKYIVLEKVYYLTTEQSTDNKTTNPQLTKLGCQQLHSPYDEMVINRSQVAFWENLKDDGKVVEAIKQYIKQNPNGPNCDAPAPETSGASTQNSTTPTQSTGN
ncbi:MAG: hypothetical protein WD887_02770 [Candidatus Saccharimonadales bacterium]